MKIFIKFRSCLSPENPAPCKKSKNSHAKLSLEQIKSGWPAKSGKIFQVHPSTVPSIILKLEYARMVYRIHNFAIRHC